MILRGIVHLAALCVLAGAAIAQDTAEDTVIDLTPMVDLMQEDAGAGSPNESMPEATDPADAPIENEAETPPANSGEASGADMAPEDNAVIDVPVRSAAPAATPTEAPQAVRLPLRPVSGPDPRRLFGEYDSASFLIDIPDPAAVTAFEILMQSSVNVLPEVSEIAVSVNGTLAAATEPFAFEGFAPLTVETSGFVAGTNRIDIVARQSHRIFCGPDATFQIWTDIDAGASGVTLAPGSLTSVSTNFASLVAGLESIAVVATDPPNPALMAELSRRIGAFGNSRAPVLVVSSPFDAVAPGPIQPRIAIRADAVDGAEIRRAADGAPVLVLAPDVSSESLDRLLPGPTPPADVPALSLGTPTRIGDLGFEDVEIRRRYGRFDVQFSLPEDWMLSANQAARIDLLYRYAEGLPASALMLVKVNGTTVRLLPLYGQPGVVLPSLPVGFPTRLLEPGINVISFETIIPGDPPEQPCSPIDGPMAEVFADTAIAIPPSPRMVFPSVATVLRGLDNAGIGVAEDAAPDGLASALGNALNVAIVPLVGGPGAEDARLTVASLAEVDRLQLTSLGLTRRAVEDLLTGRIAAPDDAGTEPLAAPGPISRFEAWLRARWAALVQLGQPGDPALADWIAGRQAVAMMLIPDPANRLSAWLIAAPGVDAVWLAEQVSAARLDPDGPKGQAALLSESGTWTVWRPAATPPMLLEPVTLTNLRTVAGNYAAWSPGLYVAMLAGLVFVSVIVALVFIVRTRGRRRR
jgi:hypothetical protein